MKTPSELSDPISQFSFSIFRINGFLLRNGDRITKSIGQSSARWQVLGRLGHKQQSVSEIARSLGHSRQSVQRLADALALEGFVEYKDNPADKRAKLATLSPSGEQTLKAIYGLYGDWRNEISSRLELQQLVKISNELNVLAEKLELSEQETK